MKSDQEDKLDKRILLILHGLLLPLVAVFGYFFLKPFIYTFKTIRYYPFQIDREEGFLIYQATRLLEFQTIYPSIESEPYIVGNYPPVYPFLTAACSLFTDTGLTAGRIVTLTAALGCCLMAGLLVYRWWNRLLIAFLAPLFISTTYAFNHWIPFARVDFVALFFSLSGVFFLTFYEKKWGVVLSVSCFLFSIYTKQNYVSGALTAFVYLFSLKEFRTMKIFGISLVIGGALIGLSLLVLTSGEAWRHLVTYNKNEMDWSQISFAVKHYWFMNRYLLILVLSCFVYCLLLLMPFGPLRPELSSHKKAFLSALLFYTAVAFLSLVTIAKRGSAVNYYLEFESVSVIIVGIALSDLLHRLATKPGKLLAGFYGVLLVLMGLHAYRSFSLPIREIIFTNPPEESFASPLYSLTLALEDLEDPILSEDPVLMMRADREIIYQPFIMAQLAREGSWNDQNFIQRIENRDFTAVLTEKPLETEYFWGFTEEMRDTILRNYRLVEQFPCFGLPKPGRRFLYLPLDPKASTEENRPQ